MMQAFKMLGTIVTVAILVGIVQAVPDHVHVNQPAIVIRGSPSYLAGQQQVEAGKISSAVNQTPEPLRPVRHVHEESHLKIVDLSHPLHNNTLHWPKNEGVTVFMNIDAEMRDPSGKPYHVRSDSIHMATHAGTHMDAPSHFSKDGWSAEKIPLERLIDVPTIVIDLSEKVAATRNYSFSRNDFIKDGKPLVKANSVVLVYTGVSQSYDIDHKAYTGTEKNSSITLMRSPGFSADAASYLVEQKVFGVGLDAISADSSDRQAVEGNYDPEAHKTFNTNNIYILENINKNLKDLIGEPSVRLFVTPLPIVNGTGSPVRLIATIGHDHDHSHASNGAASEPRSLCFNVLLTICFCVLAILI